jgi:hypothetical protein
MRKSKDQRINEGNALIAAITKDPVLAKEQSWLINFLNDMIRKFKAGKGGTSRQRDLFDEKIAAGVPARKVNTHVAQPEVLKAEAALKVLQQQPTLYSWEIRVGGEIVANGLKYNLSQKQLTLLETFVKKAEMFEKQKTATVDFAMVQEAKLLCDLADTYLGLTAKKSNDINVLQSAIGSNMPFTEEQLEAGRMAVSGELKSYNKYKKSFTPGMLVRYQPKHGETYDMCMVIDGPTVGDYGNNPVGWQTRATKSMRIPIMVDGNLVYAWPMRISKYTKKELKALGAE